MLVKIRILLIEPVWNRNPPLQNFLGDQALALLIEPVWNRNQGYPANGAQVITAFNRTSMESKLAMARATAVHSAAFNRTSMESKHRHDPDLSAEEIPFNRTSMESKLFTDKFVSVTFGTFNRTSMESKLWKVIDNFTGEILF